MKQRIISKTVWMLSLVSLFTDMASEMLYPVMPLYLKEIGFSVISIGILEGVAEAIAGLSKGYFGAWSDSIGKRTPFIRWGYGLSAGSKPLLALFTYAPWVFFCRTIDRIGKGIRTAPRDALLSDEATSATKGRVFGFHRSMDTLGAMIGPSLALLFLYFYPSQYKELFLWALLPGIGAILLTFLVKEKKNVNPDTLPSKKLSTKKPFSFKDSFTYIAKAGKDYKVLVGGLLVFFLFNSSDVFLLLKMKESGMSDTVTIGIYILYNGVYALMAYPLGHAADKIGLKKVLLSGLILFAIVYAGFAFSDSLYAFAALFMLYGIYAAATEGIAKAWISNMADKAETGVAIGSFEGFKNLAAMFASFIAGLLWYQFGAGVTFISTAIITLVVVAFLYFRARTT